MSYTKNRLSKQLFSLIILVFAIVFICLGVILPKMLIPVAEENLYNRLREPLDFIKSDVDQNIPDAKVGYLYIINKTVVTSDNMKNIIKVDNINDVLKKFTDTYGKFIYKHKTYYYYTVKKDTITKIALSDDSYINETKEKILGATLPLVFITFLLIGLILVLWSSVIVKKIEKLKDKIDNIDNEDYNHKVSFKIDDEMRSLELAIEDMRISLKNQEEYRNQMYQNISHDFKTPLTVIKSYVEAVDDGVESKEDALNIIKEQVNKLENKVYSLLYLNKLDYLKDSKNVEIKTVDMEMILKTELEKFKFQRKDVKFTLDISNKSKYTGNIELWETILDNLLGNFMRYANSSIKITAKNNRLILYNDGSNIEDDFLEGIFTPFRKGIKGQFGLGLSIVKKTLSIMDYDIIIKNEKKGVSFIIGKGIK